VATTATKIYEFTVTLATPGAFTDAMAEAVYAVVDDGTLSCDGPTASLDFHREAESLGDAIGSAVKDVERAGLAVARVEVETS
jgi:hypothetical protein